MKYGKWRSRYNRLVKEAKSIGLKVKLVPNKYTLDFIGNNPEAAKVLDMPCPKNTIVVDEFLNWKDRAETLKHEIVEYQEMKHEGMTYGEAHSIALVEEKY